MRALTCLPVFFLRLRMAAFCFLFIGASIANLGQNNKGLRLAAKSIKLKAMHEISIRAEQLFSIAGWPITNALLLAIGASIVLLVLGFDINQRLAQVPGKLQNLFEVIIEQILTLMESVLHSRTLAERYLPLVATIFLFILTANWLGLLPLGAFTYHHIPLFRSPASDLNFTIALSIIAVFSVHLIGAVVIGLKNHAHKFFNFKSPIFTFVGLLELVSEFVKIVSFSFRLFGNVFAGEVLLIIIGFLVPYALPLPFFALELFMGAIQAVIFSMLTLVFIGMATTKEAH